MATVVYSARSLTHLERAFEFLRLEHSQAAVEAVGMIRSAVDHLGFHPFLGRRLDGEIRELVISYGKTGYIALYRFVVARDEVRVLALRHQREIGFVP
jgi:plasmid stabilization system protein ParE